MDSDKNEYCNCKGKAKSQHFCSLSRLEKDKSSKTIFLRFKFPQWDTQLSQLRYDSTVSSVAHLDENVAKVQHF